jgi:Ubiquitin fusion degradation protein UFD1/UBX domain
VKRLGRLNADAETAADPVSSLPSSASASSSLLLQPTSIHGQGDKIALPPSVLETLTASMIIDDDDNFHDGSSIGAASQRQQQQQPWTFRIGILNPNYAFPASPLLQSMEPPKEVDGESDSDSCDTNDEDDVDSNNDNAAYWDELKFKYVGFTHGTVVEFTQDEGHVGLPQPIAQALLASVTPSNDSGDVAIKTMRTSDAAIMPTSNEEATDSMDVGENDDIGEKTPGHVAWGAFDLPDSPIEITLLQLPRGKTARLRPTMAAIHSGFYGLKDIKWVLEQSLARTRATLSLQDTVSTWHRGKRYDLTVMALTPAPAVSIINTDIEVEFDSIEQHDQDGSNDDNTAQGPTGAVQEALMGRRLGDNATSSSLSTRKPVVASSTIIPQTPLVLPPEPPLDETDRVVKIQIRAPAGGIVQRRFDFKHNTVADVYLLAESLLLQQQQEQQAFQLVTRFPRRVLVRDDPPSISPTLEQVGIASKQELLLVEML